MIQVQSPTCKACGSVVNASAPSPDPPPAQLKRVESPPLPPPPKAEIQEKAPLAVADSAPGHRLSFHGSGGTLFGIQIVNMLLTIVTLGIYTFWGRVKVRKYLLSQTEFEGDRFAYHGTGKELFLGFLKAGLVFSTIGLFNALPGLLGLGKEIEIAARILTFVLLMVFIPIAIVGTLRYRLSRISWRGVRFSFRGKVMDFIKIFLGGSLLSFITLGIYYPIFATRQYGYVASNAYFGNQKFHFDGQGRALLGSYLLALLLTLPTLGLYWFWFSAKMARHFWSHTSLATARFRSTITGGGFLLLHLGNLFLLVFTLGLAFPWILIRSVRFFIANLELEGALDLAAIQQDAQAASATGEGLAGLLDVDLNLG